MKRYDAFRKVLFVCKLIVLTILIPQDATGEPKEIEAASENGKDDNSAAEEKEDAPAPAASATSAQQSTQQKGASECRPTKQGEADPFLGLDHTGTPPPPLKEGRLPKQSAEPGVKRPLLSYDGRSPESLSAGEVLIWIPRVIFYPVHAVLEYVIRYPIFHIISACEEHYAIQRVKRFFTFNGGKGGFFPTAFYDFGISPSVGIYFYYDDLGIENNNLVLQAGTWPPARYHLIATDSFTVFRDNRGTVTTRGEFSYQPDKVFYGLGSDSESSKRYFHFRLTEAELCLRAALKDLHRIALGLFFRNAKISGGKSPSVDASDSPFDVNDPNSVPGFGKTYNVLSARLKLELDTRSPERVFTPGSGLRLEALSSFNINPGDTDLFFVRWGCEIAGFLDLSGLNHVLALRIYSEILEKIGDAPVPITELVALGGAEYLRGFLGGRFRGDSALEITLDYRYPIHTYLDANLFTSIGNVFDGRLSNLNFKKMVMSWGIGVRSNTSRNVSFDLMFAIGTNQMSDWDEDFEVDNVRVIVGINQGF